MKMVVAYLSTPSGDDCIEYAKVLADLLGASVNIVMVLPSNEGQGISYQSFLKSKAERWLKLSRDAFPSRFEVSTHIVQNRSFSDGLLNFSTSIGADLIILGQSKRGLLGRFGWGTWRKLLKKTPIPLTVTPEAYRKEKKIGY